MPIAGFPLVADAQDQHGIFLHLDAVQRDVATFATGDDQFPQEIANRVAD